MKSKIFKKTQLLLAQENYSKLKLSHKISHNSYVISQLDISIYIDLVIILNTMGKTLLS